MQHNKTSLFLLSQFLNEHNYDIVLLQDPPSCMFTGRQVVRGYTTFSPSTATSRSHAPSQDQLVAILVKHSIRARPIPFVHNRVCGVFVSSSLGSVAFVSAYIQPLSGHGLSALSSFVKQTSTYTRLLVVGADVNGHSSWWGPPDQVPNSLGTQVEDFLLTHHLLVLNK